MRENSSPQFDTDYQRSLVTEPKTDQPAELISIAGGIYQDPDPNIVDWINKKFKDPNNNVEATLMKAFEWAGIVKTTKEVKSMTQPLEHSGLLPIEGKGEDPPSYSTDPTRTSEFIDRRDDELLLELDEGNDARNNVLLKVIEMTRLRSTYDEKQERELWTFGMTRTKGGREIPPALRIIMVMVGTKPPEDPKNGYISEVPKQTHEMAADVYWMMLREEIEANTQATEAVA